MKKLIAGLILVSAVIVSASETMTAAVNDFGLSLFKKVPEANNRLISPVSLYTAFSMTVPGAKGNTRDELAKALSCGTDQELGESVNSALTSLKSDSGSLSLVNAAWLQKNFKVNADFSAILENFWKSAFYPADFIKNFNKARKEINLFTEKNTDGKIKNLLSKGALDNKTRLVLLNALYFKAKWATEFDKKSSYKGKFRFGKKFKSTNFMFMKSDFDYYETEQFSALEIPYHDKVYSMIILLPTDAKGLPALIKSLNSKLFTDLKENTNTRKVEVHLPSFAFKTSYELKKPLVALGIKDAFSLKADFSGIEPSKMLLISKVFHGAGIEVDESGTTAAAATAVVVSRKTLAVAPLIFKANRPFCFFIRHNETGLLLFAGEVKKL